MKILMIYGSPHKNGTTNAMAEAFLAGLDQKKHTVQSVHVSQAKIAPCLGCDHCKKSDGICVQKDDMQELLPMVLEADLVVFVTPLYYFGFSAQMKTFIDRFYAVNPRLRQQTEKKAILLTAGGGREEWIMDGLLANYRTMLRYLNWENIGEICAVGCHRKEDLAGTSWPEAAETMGKRL